jgi:hypothetical protein
MFSLTELKLSDSFHLETSSVSSDDDDGYGDAFLHEEFTNQKKTLEDRLETLSDSDSSEDEDSDIAESDLPENSNASTITAFTFKNRFDFSKETVLKFDYYNQATGTT